MQEAGQEAAMLAGQNAQLKLALEKTKLGLTHQNSDTKDEIAKKMNEAMDKMAKEHTIAMERLTKKQSKQTAIIAAHLDKMGIRNHQLMKESDEMRE